jgi:hypothetical protein
MFVSTRHQDSISKLTFSRPVVTYSGQGTKKKGIHLNSHAFVYSQNRTTPENTNRLDRGLSISYANSDTDTEEHNFKIWFTGTVDGKLTDSDQSQAVNTSQVGILSLSIMEPARTRSFYGSCLMAQGEYAILLDRLDLKPNDNNTVLNWDLTAHGDATHGVIIEVLDDWELVEEHGELFLILGHKTGDYDERKNTRSSAHSEHLTLCSPQPGCPYTCTKRTANPMKSMAKAHSDIYGVYTGTIFLNCPKVLAGMGMGSGFLLSASFLWLDKSMGLSTPSPAMNWVRTSYPI